MIIAWCNDFVWLRSYAYIGVEFMCDRVGRTAYKEYPPPSLKPKSKNFSKFSAFKQNFWNFCPPKFMLAIQVSKFRLGRQTFRVGRKFFGWGGCQLATPNSTPMLIGTFSTNVSKEEDNSAGSSDFIESNEDADMFQPKNYSTQISDLLSILKKFSLLKCITFYLSMV